MVLHTAVPEGLFGTADGQEKLNPHARDVRERWPVVGFLAMHYLINNPRPMAELRTSAATPFCIRIPIPSVLFVCLILLRPTFHLPP